VGERHVLLLPERALRRLLRYGEAGRRGERDGAHVAGGEGEDGEKEGGAVSLHGSPLPDAYSRPYFFGLFPMMAAARICGTYSSVSSGSFFSRYRCQKSRLSLRNPPGCCASSCSTLRMPFSPLLYEAMASMKESSPNSASRFARYRAAPRVLLSTSVRSSTPRARSTRIPNSRARWSMNCHIPRALAALSASGSKPDSCQATYPISSGRPRALNSFTISGQYCCLRL